jgi:uncharacterized membrane protein YeaQ/YmgE (transglycosylase-associated protein family)
MGFFGFIWWLIIGLVAGLLARLIMPGRDSMGLIATILLGIVGSVIGGLVSMAIWPAERSGGIPRAGIIFSIIGAIIVLFVWRMIRGSSSVT